jgi:hypothetical protein
MAQPILPELSLQDRLWCCDLLPPVNKRIIALARFKGEVSWKRGVA